MTVNLRLTPEKSNHLTSLYSVGSALLYYAVDELSMDELISWKEYELGNPMS
jgi:hypothetical protein